MNGAVSLFCDMDQKHCINANSSSCRVCSVFPVSYRFDLFHRVLLRVQSNLIVFSCGCKLKQLAVFHNEPFNQVYCAKQIKCKDKTSKLVFRAWLNHVIFSSSMFRSIEQQGCSFSYEGTEIQRKVSCDKESLSTCKRKYIPTWAACLCEELYLHM